eukprot:CAMPEP_0168195052 /NCGR_PEP_ID=MMETSP0139_2-20121125/19611_1 /TAXON_ID=44445 /ORGANISM="Pseudo-nitzschia australis, Strain 10249 10 AB" /LENGTH=1022 /DNA_ID=CAMNT_0008118803 /DNA_START=15 /DNA_END=3083 /DNA_ORIENTATION=-
MRFYDKASDIDRQRALKDLSGNIKRIWPRLPNEWRIDKEFVLKVLELASVVPVEDDANSNINSNATLHASINPWDDIDNNDNDENNDNDTNDDTSGSNNQNQNENENDTSDYLIEEEDFILEDTTSDSTTTATNTLNESAAAAAESRNTVNIMMALPSKSDFERRFPRFKCDPDVILAWTKRPDFPRLFRERHLFLPPCQNSNRQICLEYCRTIPRSLQDCHVDLCDDRELVEAAVKHCGGLELQYATQRLQCHDEELVRKACMSNGKALLFCPVYSDAFSNIINDREFMLNVVLGGTGTGTGTGCGNTIVDNVMDRDSTCTRTHTRSRSTSTSLPPSTSPSGPMWKLLPPLAKRTDRELALAALRNGLSLRDVPQYFINADFLQRALANKSVPLYLELSHHWQSHPRLALEAILAEDSTPRVHARVFELEEKRNNRNRERKKKTSTSSTCCSLGGDSMNMDMDVDTDDRMQHDNDDDDSSSSANAIDSSSDPSLFLPLRENRDVILAVCKRGSKKLLHELLGKPRKSVPVNGDPFGRTHGIRNGIGNLPRGMNLERFLRRALDGEPGRMGIFDDDVAIAEAVADGMVMVHDIDNDSDHDNDAQPLPRLRRQSSLERQAYRLPRILDDYHVMKFAVRRDPSLFGNISIRLQQNPDIILASIRDGASAWSPVENGLLSWAIQRRNPKITAKCLRYSDTANLDFLPEYIPDDIWIANRALRSAWIRRDGFLMRCFFPGLYTDQEMALEVAKYTPAQFGRLGGQFLNDREFTIKALEQNGQCVEYISPYMKEEFEIITTAAANYYNEIDKCSPPAKGLKGKSMMEVFEEICDLHDTKQKIHQKIELHDVFVMGFLRGIAIPIEGSNLAMLDRGVETSEAFKRSIADYLAVPFAKEVTRLRKALANIERAESEWDFEPESTRNRILSERGFDGVVASSLGRNNNNFDIPNGRGLRFTLTRRRLLAHNRARTHARMVRQRMQLVRNGEVVADDGTTNRNNDQERLVVVDLIAEDLRRIRAGEPVEGL